MLIVAGRAFFVLMWLVAIDLGPSKEDLGTMLNNFNLAAVTVVILASVKTQIYGMRKTVVTWKKNLQLCAKFTHKFVRDPYGQCCAPAEVARADLHPLGACIDCSH